MANFENNQTLDPDGGWTDITSTFTGQTVEIQNTTPYDTVQIWLGPTAPASLVDGVSLPSQNWPLYRQVVASKLWARCSADSAQVHVSLAD